MNYCEEREEAACPKCEANERQREMGDWLENSKSKLEQSNAAWNAASPQEESNDLSLVEKKLRSLEAQESADPSLKDLDGLVKSCETRDGATGIEPEETPQDGTLMELEEKVKAIELASGATATIDPVPAIASVEEWTEKRAEQERKMAEEKLKSLEEAIDPGMSRSPLQELNDRLERMASHERTWCERLIYEFESRNLALAIDEDIPHKTAMLAMSLVVPYIFLVVAVVFMAKGRPYRSLGLWMAPMCLFMIAVHIALVVMFY
jgi:hypothetical protein